MPRGSESASSIVMFSADAGFAQALAAALAGSSQIVLDHRLGSISAGAAGIDFGRVKVIVADIDAGNRDHLVALQHFMMQVAGRAPVLVITPSFDDAVARWFLQIKVADFLRKPVEPVELLRSCVKAIQSAAPAEARQASHITTLMPSAGGVGVTTLAIESALQLMRLNGGSSACLVDLDFHYGCCADYLDLEPRLDLDEIGAQHERLDSQLLEVMLAKHSTGLHVLAAPSRPAQISNVNTALVARILDLASSRFQHVIIDMPKHWRPWTDIVLMGSDRVFVVTDMTVPGIRSARRVAGVINERLSDQVRAEVIVNRYEQNLIFGSGLRRADIDKALESMLAGTVSNNYRVVREAIDRGVPLEAVKSSNSVSADLKKFIAPAPRDAALRVA